MRISQCRNPADDLLEIKAVSAMIYQGLVVFILVQAHCIGIPQLQFHGSAAICRQDFIQFGCQQRIGFAHRHVVIFCMEVPVNFLR